MNHTPESKRRNPAPGLRLSAGLLAVLAALCVGGCSVGQYLGDRGMDVIDVVDLKYGFGSGTMGAGFKLELTEFFGLAVGYGYSDMVHEGRGRFAWDEANEFAHYLLFGGDGPKSRPVINMYGFNTFYYGPGTAQWRVGLEVLLPLAHVGGYLNLMEIVDLLAGLFTFDLSNDDGVRLGEPLEN